jgi:glycosyltransferase involved in cell wall biosynthesis
MNAAGQMVCLNMIVKDEAEVIRRCLDSVRPIIDRWVIVDTGSTDGTQDIIRAHLKDLPGELHERPWRDFAHNRSEALALARGKGDYTFIIDADDTLKNNGDDALPALTGDSYMVTINDATIVYQRPQLVRSALPWRYEGVLHEYLTCEGAAPHGRLSEITMRRNNDGARRKDPTTYRRDVTILEAALRTETNPFLIARYRFYLAQSYRDCRDREKALENYLLRAELGFWQEEVFISLYAAAQLKEQLGRPEREVIDAYLRASDALPTRAEALHNASRFCRHKGRHDEGYQIARRGLAIPLPTDALFVEPWIYGHGLLDEFSVNAYHSGRKRESLDASLKILTTAKLSAEDMARVVENARLASEGLPRGPLPGASAAESLAELHGLRPQRALRSRVKGEPRVLVAILASQKEAVLPLYLECIEALDYPKSAIVLHIHACDSTDGTERLLREWVERNGDLYAGVEFECDDVEGHARPLGGHERELERELERARRLGQVRNGCLDRAEENACDFCFIADVGHFVRPCTLRELVALDLPIVAPFLRSVEPGNPYSNYHSQIDANGYFKESDLYSLILGQQVRGILEQPVVNGCYLVRTDVREGLSGEDATARHPYVIFSESARRLGVPQYLDNRQVYGYMVLRDAGDLHTSGEVERARFLLRSVDTYAEGVCELPDRSSRDWNKRLKVLPTTPYPLRSVSFEG